MFDNLINVSGKALTWQGQELAQMGEFDRIRITDTLKIHINIQQYAAINYRKAKLYGINYMYVSNKVKFYKKDIKKNIHNRLKKIYDECKNNGISTAIFLLDEKQAGGIDEFKKYIGMSKDFVIENLSTLPYDVEETDTKSVYNPKNAVKILRYDGRNGYSQTNSSWWIKETVNTDDTTQTFYYIAIDRYIPTAITSYSNETTASYINKYINVLDQIKTTIPAIYGVKISELEKIEKKSNWIKFEDYVKSCFENYMKIQNIEQIHGDNNMFNISNYYTEEGQSNRKFLSLIQCFENTIDINIQKWMKRYEDTQKYHDILNHIQNYTRLFNNVGLTVKSIDSSKEYNEFLNDFFNRYKLLKYIKNDDSTKCIAEIKKYVNMLDNVACIW